MKLLRSFTLMLFLTLISSKGRVEAVARTSLCDAIEDQLEKLKDICEPSRDTCAYAEERLEEAKNNYYKWCVGQIPGYGGRLDYNTPYCRQLRQKIKSLDRMKSACYACIDREPDRCKDFQEIEKLIRPDIDQMCSRDRNGLNQCSEICADAASFQCKR